jgi:pimeloyl-ACP methyl ester carboxylesterase
MKVSRAFAAGILFVSLTFVARTIATAAKFEVTLDPRVASQPVSGRLYVFLSQRGTAEPRFGPDWFHPEPFFRIDVQDFRAGTSQALGDSAAAFPDRLSRIPPGRYRAQAVLANDIYSCEPGKGVGNLFSRVVEVQLSGQVDKLPIALDQRIEEKRFPDVKWIKEVAIKSDLLTKFHHREVIERAAVVLPAAYFEQTDRRFPVIYVVPWFGGSYREALQVFAAQPPRADEGEEDFIRVMLDGQCEWGHHVYADSATNGPRGEALIREMSPEIDRQFRTVAKSGGRFVAGHSSGGWSSLWLQVTYPDTFGGVWSTSPDPVDFRDYQRIDLYADPPQNMYRDSQNQRRPIARRGETPVLWYDTFTKMDDVLGRGGQLRSFEAAFSPLGADGLPRRLWDRSSGRIDPEVAKAWQPYDIRLKLERNWSALEPQLRGKLHIRTGSLDTFYLEGAVARLAETLKQLGSDAQVTIVPGADHNTVLTPDYFRQSRREMSEAFRRMSSR